MIALACPYCKSKNIEILKNDDYYTKFKCDNCEGRWGMKFEIIDIAEEGESE